MKNSKDECFSSKLTFNKNYVFKIKIFKFVVN